ncbi:photosystem II reaction center PsbP [Leptolyngbya sp. FACHB-17]|uniref:photosystem II reaction center PsbP n=1 Tax=unclassified Leptolyngbya TaxID=2650499 RepID=UPI00167FFC9C|nr:photosystem II reaction center PsbP [Leptolyngbya sp. FACHB-17]MBD2078885.1 photosystem II reaction center PsbP family protein [Leptolyngbya sp. FACHB-17]
MLKRIIAVMLVVLALGLQGCVSGVGGLKSFIDSTDGYRFLYPNGWLPVKVTNGPDVVFHDIIVQTENISMVINPVPGKKKLAELGTPSEVGYQLGKSAIAPPDSGRTAELISAESREIADRTYYLLEYLVTLPNQEKRHNLANAIVYRSKLYTLNASTSEERWEKMAPILTKSVKSFMVD